MNKLVKSGFHQLVVFLIVITIGFSSVFYIHILFQDLKAELHAELDNEKVRTTIGRYVLSHLDALEVKIYQIALEKDGEYSKAIRETIILEIQHLNDSYVTLNEGGYIIHHVDLNFANIRSYPEKLYYEPSSSDNYSINIMELEPTLDLVLDEVDQLIVLIEEYGKATEEGDPRKIEKIDEEINNQLKTISHYFVSMKESASQLVYESMIKIDENIEAVKYQKHFFRVLEVVVTVVMFSVILALGYILGKQIVTTNKELSNLAYNAEKANIAKSVFVANMSHEIRTPLNAIIGFAEILENRGMDGENKEYVHIITRSAKSLLDIVNDILDLSKIENDSMKLESVSFNLSDLFEETVELYTIEANEKHIRVEYNVDANIPKYVFGDPVRLRQIISNLLSNAIKFTGDGGIVQFVVKVYYSNYDHVKLCISIIDNGIGIPKGKQKEIFSAFAQAEAGTTRKYGGTGLGLAISKRLASAMGSELYVQSEEGKGSDFYFILNFDIDISSIETEEMNQMDMTFGVCCPEVTNPLLRKRIIVYLKEFGNIVEDFIPIYHDKIDVIFVFYNVDIYDRLSKINKMYPNIPIIFVGDISRLGIEERVYIKDVVDEPIYGSKLFKIITRYYREIKMNDEKGNKGNQYVGTVLVAEDNLTNQKLIEIFMKKFGLSPFFANNGEEAIDLYKKINPDLVFLDIHMPIMGGVEAATEIVKLQNIKAYDKVPLVALTADLLDANRNKYMEAGLSEYLTKPIDIKALENVFKMYLKSDTIYDLEDVSSFLAIDKDNLKIIIDEFFVDLANQLGNIQIAVASKNTDDAKFAIHSLKGAASNLRFDKEVALLNEFESYIDERLFDKVDVKQLDSNFQVIKEAIDGQYR